LKDSRPYVLVLIRYTTYNLDGIVTKTPNYIYLTTYINPTLPGL